MRKFNFISSNSSTASDASDVARILEKNKLNILIITINVLILVKVTVHFYMLPVEMSLIILSYEFYLEKNRSKI